MNLKSYSFSILLLLLFFSCDSAEENNPKLDYSDAIQMEKGNYWVYESSSIDLESGIKTVELDDSIFISKDTIVNNKVFYVFENLFGLRELKTESGGDIVSLENNIEFSATNFTDTLYRDPNLSLYGMMKKVDEEIIVPAGKFKTVMFIILEKNIPGHNHSTDLTNPSVYSKEYSIHKKIWYAEKIGVVKSVFYYGNFTGFENNLKRYKVR